MPREIAIFGILIPTLLPVFLLAGLLHAAVDWLCGRHGIYRHVWHRGLFRLCLLICLCGALAAIIFSGNLP